MDFIRDFIADNQTVIAVAILAAVFIGFLFERFPPSAVATAGAIMFLLTGLISTQDVLQVFSNPAPITIAAMFILSGALVRTGVIDAASAYFVEQARKHGWIAFISLLAGACVISGLMNNTPLVVVLIPVVIRMADALGVSSTRLLIPLSYAAILGGTLTLVGTSTNLLIDGVARREGLAPLGMLEIMPYGLAAIFAGAVTLAILGPMLLPNRGSSSAATEDEDIDFLTEVRLSPKKGRGKSEDAGDGKPEPEEKPLTLGDLSGLAYTKLRAVLRGLQRFKPASDLAVKRGDRIVLTASRAEIMTLEENPNYEVGLNARDARPVTDEDALVRVEVIVAPEQSGSGRRVADLGWSSRFGVRLLGVARHRHSPGPELSEVRLRPADRLLLEGPATAVSDIITATDLIASTEVKTRPFRRRRAPIAILAVLGVVTLAVFEVAPIVTLALIAVGLILLTRCMEADEAWGAIDGSTLMLIFAMLAIGVGLENTRVIESLVEWMTPMLAEASPLVLLIAVYALTSFLTELVSNNAVAVIVTPLAIGLAQSLAIDPLPLVYAVMLAASASFATPIGYQTNTLVYSAGNYRFMDFMKIGSVMNVTIGLASCLAIWMFAPF